MRIEDREDFADLVAQAVIDRIEETDSSKPTDAAKLVVTETSLQAIERERLSRRAVLRKFGFGAGMFALLALSGDDLARMAATKLKQYTGDNKVAGQIANEFKNAGIAFATVGPSCAGCGNCVEDDESECVDCQPQCAATAQGANKKKQWVPCKGKKSCGSCGTSFYDKCVQSNPENPINCCDVKCSDCCAPGVGGPGKKPLLPCGQNSNAIVALCQQACQAAHDAHNP